MEQELDTASRKFKYYTLPRISSPVGRRTTKGGAILPEENTSVSAPVMLFIIIYSRLIPRHMLSAHQAIDFKISGTPNSFTSTNSRPPDKNRETSQSDIIEITNSYSLEYSYQHQKLLCLPEKKIKEMDFHETMKGTCFNKMEQGNHTY